MASMAILLFNPQTPKDEILGKPNHLTSDPKYKGTLFSSILKVGENKLFLFF